MSKFSTQNNPSQVKPTNYPKTMATEIAYLYTARDKMSFDAFVLDAAQCGSTVTIDPAKQTVLLTTTEDKMTGTSDDPVCSLRDMIFAKELKVEAELVETAPDIIKEIADLNKQNDYLRDERDRYVKWHSDAYGEISRIKKQVAAIGTLIDAIGQ